MTTTGKVTMGGDLGLGSGAGRGGRLRRRLESDVVDGAEPGDHGQLQLLQMCNQIGPGADVCATFQDCLTMVLGQWTTAGRRRLSGAHRPGGAHGLHRRHQLDDRLQRRRRADHAQQVLRSDGLLGDVTDGGGD